MEALELVDYILWLVLIIVAVAVTATRSLVKALVYLTVFSLIAAGLYMSMGAPDVAITEAAIGAAVSTLFFLATIQIVGREENSPRKYVFAASVLMLTLLFFTLLSVPEIPEYGDINSPANQYVAEYYIENSYPETGIKNSVTAVLGSYRGFDTLGEVYVILAAGIAVLLILPLNMWRNEPK